MPSTVSHRRPEEDTILPRLTSLFALFGFLAAVASWSGAARATEPDQLAFAVGYFDMFDEDKAAQIRAEYRFDEASKLWIFTPFVGFSATNEGGAYGYGGIGVDIFFGKRLVVTPNFAAGPKGRDVPAKGRAPGPTHPADHHRRRGHDDFDLSLAIPPGCRRCSRLGSCRASCSDTTHRPPVWICYRLFSH